MSTEKLDTYHYHEALDRAHTLGEIAATMLEKHQVTKQHPEFRDKFYEVIDAIQELYQLAASIAQKNGG